jgi:signal transduction histidine kinase
MQLKQVFMNLLVNAYQAIAERVGESGELGTIRLRTEAVDGAVVVTVADDGTGISEEDRQRIFDPFFTTKKVGVGMGLGLSTSFQIVERHGGTLAVTSALGVGTTMRLSLPLLELREPGA